MLFRKMDLQLGRPNASVRFGAAAAMKTSVTSVWSVPDHSWLSCYANHTVRVGRHFNAASYAPIRDPIPGCNGMVVVSGYLNGTAEWFQGAEWPSEGVSPSCPPATRPGSSDTIAASGARDEFEGPPVIRPLMLQFNRVYRYTE